MKSEGETVDMIRANKNWFYAQMSLEKIHPSFKLHMCQPYSSVMVGFQEDVNPLCMFGEYLMDAAVALGERFDDVVFDFYNLDDFYAKNLSFDLGQVVKDASVEITLKDKADRLDQLVVDDVNVIGITRREISSISRRDDGYFFTVPEGGVEETYRFFINDLLEVGATFFGQRIAKDFLFGDDPQFFAYDHPADLKLNEVNLMEK